MEALLCVSMGLPQHIVCDILEHAQYWIRTLEKGGKVVVMDKGAACVAKVQIPKSARQYRPVRRIVFVADAMERGGSTQNNEPVAPALTQVCMRQSHK